MEIVLLKTGIRFVVFVLVFWLAARRIQKVRIEPRWAVPLVGTVFAILNVGLYWLLKPVLGVATVNLFGLAIPFLLNGLFLYLTIFVVSKMRAKLEIEGTMAMFKMCLVVTITHGALWLILDMLFTN